MLNTKEIINLPSSRNYLGNTITINKPFVEEYLYRLNFQRVFEQIVGCYNNGNKKIKDKTIDTCNILSKFHDKFKKIETYLTLFNTHHLEGHMLIFNPRYGN